MPSRSNKGCPEKAHTETADVLRGRPTCRARLDMCRRPETSIKSEFVILEVMETPVGHCQCHRVHTAAIRNPELIGATGARRDETVCRLFRKLISTPAEIANGEVQVTLATFPVIVKDVGC